MLLGDVDENVLVVAEFLERDLAQAQARNPRAKIADRGALLDPNLEQDTASEIDTDVLVLPMAS